MNGGASGGRMLIIGGAEDRCCGSGVLERFVADCGGGKARIVLITTATGAPSQVLAEYEQVFGKLGVKHVSELAISGRSDADSSTALRALNGATGVFFSGGDQSRLQALVGSRLNAHLRQRLADGLVIAGTSAGATALGRTMILGDGQGGTGGAGGKMSLDVSTGPGLGLLPNLLIDMHFGERGRLPRLLSAVALEPERLGVGIDENTAISVRGGCFEVVGSGTVSVVDAEGATVVHPASPDDPITLFGVRLHLLPAGCVFDTGSRTPAISPAHARY